MATFIFSFFKSNENSYKSEEKILYMKGMSENDVTEVVDERIFLFITDAKL